MVYSFGLAAWAWTGSRLVRMLMRRLLAGINPAPSLMCPIPPSV